MSKLNDALRYLDTAEHAITVRELANRLQVSKGTAHDYLKQLQRHGRAAVGSTSGREQLWIPANNPPDPSVKTRNSRAYDRRAAANPNGYPQQPEGYSGAPFGSVDAVVASSVTFTITGGDGQHYEVFAEGRGTQL